MSNEQWWMRDDGGGVSTWASTLGCGMSMSYDGWAIEHQLSPSFSSTARPPTRVSTTAKIKPNKQKCILGLWWHFYKLPMLKQWSVLAISLVVLNSWITLLLVAFETSKVRQCCEQTDSYPSGPQLNSTQCPLTRVCCTFYADHSNQTDQSKCVTTG